MRSAWTALACSIVVLGGSASAASASTFGFGTLASATSGSGADRTMTLRRSGTTVQLLERGRVASRPAARPGSPLKIAGTPGNDTLRIDFSGGNPAPDGVVFDAGAQAGGAGDALEIVGGRFRTTRVTFTPDRPGHGHDGAVTLDGTRIAFYDLEPLTLNGTAADRVFDIPQGDGNNQTVLEDDPGHLGRCRSCAASRARSRRPRSPTRRPA